MALICMYIVGIHNVEYMVRLVEADLKIYRKGSKCKNHSLGIKYPILIVPL